MARKRFCQRYKATTACTLRLAAGAGLKERDLRAEDKPARVLVGDSWFASYETAEALDKELGLGFIGNVKTAHRGFPLEQCRWDLSMTERGDHVVYKHTNEGDLDAFTVGWNDHHFKTFIATSGTTDEGSQAKRKRQNDLGQTRYKLVKRPKVIEDYYSACGQIDQHNNHRQGGMKLKKYGRRRNGIIDAPYPPSQCRLWMLSKLGSITPPAVTMTQSEKFHPA